MPPLIRLVAVVLPRVRDSWTVRPAPRFPTLMDADDEHQGNYRRKQSFFFGAAAPYDTAERNPAPASLGIAAQRADHLVEKAAEKQISVREMDAVLTQMVPASMSGLAL
jgi:hypothetical protein